MRRMIVYIGYFSFPLGDAVAKRALGIGKCFNAIGYKVAFIGVSMEVVTGSISDECRYHEFIYCNLHKCDSAAERLLFRMDLSLTLKRIDEWNEREGIAAVLFCGTKCALFANGLVMHCKKKHIPIIADSMDWLKIHTGNVLFDVLKQADINYEIRRVNRKADAVIAISQYLADYYSHKGMRTIVIPPLSSYKDTVVQQNVNTVPIVIYAGIPCRLGRPIKNVHDAKDRIDCAIELFYQIHADGHLFRFDVYGLTEFEYITIFPKHRTIVSEMIIEKKLFFYGYQKEDVVEKAIISADFTILLRENNRMTKAGFPTKVAESIALGIPVITTTNGDISRYLSDGFDSFFVDIEKPNEAKDKMCSLLYEDHKVLYSMKHNVESNKSFDVMSYVEPITQFINSIAGGDYEV